MSTSSHLVQCFPGLGTSAYSITSPSDWTYNCIAWAAGYTGAWWSPDSMDTSYWPDDVTREVSLEAFVAAFESIGYSPCDSEVLEAGYEKVALFTMGGVPTHAARQLPSGMWTSKLGRWVDIAHSLRALEGDEYGNVDVLLKRRTS